MDFPAISFGQSLMPGLKSKYSTSAAKNRQHESRRNSEDTLEVAEEHENGISLAHDFSKYKNRFESPTSRDSHSPKRSSPSFLNKTLNSPGKTFSTENN